MTDGAETARGVLEVLEKMEDEHDEVESRLAELCEEVERRHEEVEDELERLFLDLGGDPEDLQEVESEEEIENS